MAAEGFLEKAKRFFHEGNGGEPLTIADLVRVIRKVAPNFKGDDQEIASIFLDLDINNDKRISWEEFEAVVKQRDPKEVKRAELETLFNELDVDKSGKLNKEEIKRLVKSVGAKDSDEHLNAIIDHVDHNKDGEISHTEFLEAWFQKEL